MVRSPLRWVGGKFRVRDQIIEKFPPHHCYVELFSGAAWVLFGKDPAMSKSEILNDMDGELVNFWRVIKHRPAEFTEAAAGVLASRELFNEWKALGRSSTSIRPIARRARRAYRHWFTDEDHARLADVLMRQVKGKWLLSYNDDPFIRQLYRGPARGGRRVKVEELSVPYSVMGGGIRKRVTELLIRNY